MAESAMVINRLANAVLESRLTDWAREYGGSRYASLGWSTGPHILAKLIEFGGFLPGTSAPAGGSGMTAADEVEQIVKRLAKTWPDHAKVLRCDYFSPGMAMPARLDMLRRAGYRISRAGYYIKLESAKLYVAGSLYG